MGQKINPHGFRVGIIKNWDSRWFAKDAAFGDLLVEDYRIREYLKKLLYSAGVPKIEIERDNTRVRIFLHCARPGVVIGRGGTEIEKIRATIEKMIKKPVALNIVEVKNTDLNAQLVAENIASQLEKRISFRRAMKQAMGRTMKFGAKGIKTAVSGRLGGAEIARSEHYHEGTIPLQTIRADIDYGFSEAKTTYGRIGVKVWIYKGEVITKGPRAISIEIPAPRHDRKPPDRRDGDRRPPRQFGDNRGPRNFNDNRGPRPAGGGYQQQPRPAGGGYQQQPRPAGGGFQQQPRPAGGFQQQPRPVSDNLQQPRPTGDRPPRREGGAN